VTLWSRVLAQLRVAGLVRTFYPLEQTGGFITVYTISCHYSLPWLRTFPSVCQVRGPM